MDADDGNVLPQLVGVELPILVWKELPDLEQLL